MIATVRELEKDLIVAALDTARIGLCVFDQNARIVMANQEFTSKLNLLPDQVINQGHSALSTHDLVVNNLRDLVDLDGDEVATEGRYQRHDGHVSLLLFQGRTLTTAEGSKYRVISVLDITHFGVSRDRYIELRRQLDALNRAVVLVDAKQSRMPIMYVNKRFEEMTGYSASEAVGRNCRFLQGDQREQSAISKLRTAIDSHQSCHALLHNFKKDGTPFLNELFISPVYDSNGKLALYIGIQQEINGRLPPYATGNA